MRKDTEKLTFSKSKNEENLLEKVSRASAEEYFKGTIYKYITSEAPKYSLLESVYSGVQSHLFETRPELRSAAQFFVQAMRKCLTDRRVLDEKSGDKESIQGITYYDFIILELMWYKVRLMDDVEEIRKLTTEAETYNRNARKIANYLDNALDNLEFIEGFTILNHLGSYPSRNVFSTYVNKNPDAIQNTSYRINSRTPFLIYQEHVNIFYSSEYDVYLLINSYEASNEIEFILSKEDYEDFVEKAYAGDTGPYSVIIGNKDPYMYGGGVLTTKHRANAFEYSPIFNSETNTMVMVGVTKSLGRDKAKPSDAIYQLPAGSPIDRDKAFIQTLYTMSLEGKLDGCCCIFYEKTLSQCAESVNIARYYSAVNAVLARNPFLRIRPRMNELSTYDLEGYAKRILTKARGQHKKVYPLTRNLLPEVNVSGNKFSLTKHAAFRYIERSLRIERAFNLNQSKTLIKRIEDADWYTGEYFELKDVQVSSDETVYISKSLPFMLVVNNGHIVTILYKNYFKSLDYTEVLSCADLYTKV